MSSGGRTVGLNSWNHAASRESSIVTDSGSVGGTGVHTLWCMGEP